jgi:excinuclease ABC subunit C
VVFFIRGGRNYGNKTYINELKNDETIEELAESLLGQFYQTNIPAKQILVNVELANGKVLEEALYKLYGLKVKISTPKLGLKKDVIDTCSENARLALQKRIKERIKNDNLLAAVAKLFHIEKPIKRIEIYDNSHISGTNPVGCMVVAGPDGFIKREYRRYNIKTSNSGDDYAMMTEVITRRLAKLSELNKPDIMIIDGGKGQLSSVMKVMQANGVNDIIVVAMAKGVDRNAGREFFHLPDRQEFQLPKGDPVLLYLQNIRDEVHRYAIGSHRLKREKQIRRSELDDIPGIGSYRKRQILRYFGSVAEAKNASIPDLMRINGISKKIAEMIYSNLHK